MRYKNILIILLTTLFISGCESVDDSPFDQAMQGETTTTKDETSVEVDASTDATSLATQ